eukprot:6481963-Amphidinium_carterae.3
MWMPTANMPVTIQANCVGRMFNKTLLRPHQKRNSRKHSHLDWIKYTRQAQVQAQLQGPEA